jgi:hypothetical protein
MQEEAVVLVVLVEVLLEQSVARAAEALVELQLLITQLLVQ